MAKSFTQIADSRIGVSDTLTFGKFVGCRVCDILPDNWEYVLWLQSKSQNFTAEVIENARRFKQEHEATQYQREEVAPFLDQTNIWFSEDWDDDIPF